MNNELSVIVDNLKKGNIILLRADDAWSLICDIDNDKAIEKLLLIKGNKINDPFVILLNNENMILKYVKEIPEIVWEVLEVSDSPLTIFLPGGINISEKILLHDGSIAIRILKDEFCKNIVKLFNKPILATWATINSENIPFSFNKIDQNIIRKVDYIAQKRDKIIFNKPAGILKFGINGEVQVIRI